jgi:hypothetical protein
MILMGGYGSGSWYSYNTKSTVEDCLTLSLPNLMRNKFVVPGRHSRVPLTWTNSRGENVASIHLEANLKDPEYSWMRLVYNKSKQPMDYRVRLATTQPNYGGLRWWLIRPYQGIRTTKLLSASGNAKFASRQALRLIYQSQREPSYSRWQDKAHALRRKLNRQGEGASSYITKPKGMQWKTYNNLIKEIQRLENASLWGLATQIGMIGEDGLRAFRIPCQARELDIENVI